jgi:fatty acid desaturase
MRHATNSLQPSLGLHARADWQSVTYLVVVPALFLTQWMHGFNPLLYAAMLVLWVGVGVIHHNHAHRPMWQQRRLNRATDLWVSALQGHPTFAFHCAHNSNHHRHAHGAQDIARTYRFARGDTNDAWGYLRHPFEAATVLLPRFAQALQQWRRSPRADVRAAWRWAMWQYALIAGVWSVALWVDPWKALLYLGVPQAIAMHTLLAANYLQHAHANPDHPQGYARSFEGLVNRLYFNIGLHLAHHQDGRLHWSLLPQAHARLRAQHHPALLESHGVLRYMGRVMVLGMFSTQHRSVSLRTTMTLGAVRSQHDKSDTSNADAAANPTQTTT